MTTDIDAMPTFAPGESPYLGEDVRGSIEVIAGDCDHAPGRLFGVNRGLESTVAA